MRDLILVLGMLFYIPLCVRVPAAGVICWAWVSVMSPHQQVYGFAQGQPFNLAIDLATLLGLVLSQEPKRWPSDASPWILLIFVVWMTITTAAAPFPEYSWHYWDRFMRELAVVFLTYFLINTKARMHGLMWALAISLGFYSLKGGVFTIVHAGQYHVGGPPDTMIGDNNQLALAIVMITPVINYLRLQTRDKLLQLGLMVALGLSVIMVFGSQSRGGVMALAASLGVLLLRSRRKLAYSIIAIAVLAAALNFMPEAWWQRMHTVQDLNDDQSFQGRVMAWHVAYFYARDHFPFGAGFYAPQLAPIFNSYYPGVQTHAAHSIYFQVLGEHGFIGLFIYVALLLVGLRDSQQVRNMTRNRPELVWAFDLSSMLQVSVVGFCFGGAGLSMAYFDGFLLLLAVLATLKQLVRNQLAPEAERNLAGRLRFARRGAAVPAGQAAATPWRPAFRRTGPPSGPARA